VLTSPCGLQGEVLQTWYDMHLLDVILSDRLLMDSDISEGLDCLFIPTRL
jgi:hypothetical protein